MIQMSNILKDEMIQMSKSSNYLACKDRNYIDGIIIKYLKKKYGRKLKYENPLYG